MINLTINSCCGFDCVLLLDEGWGVDEVVGSLVNGIVNGIFASLFSTFISGTSSFGNIAFSST